MPDKIISIPNVGDIAFPDSMSEEEMSAAAQRLYAQGNTKSNGSGMGAMAAALGSGLAAKGLSAFANNPAVMTGASTFARTVAPAATLAGAAYEGYQSGGPLGALKESIQAIPGAAVAGWAAGKPAYRTARFLQNVARPVADIAEKVVPVVRAFGGAQGALDLAQMAEPDRKDIGIIGGGKTVQDEPWTPAKQDAQDLRLVGQLVEQGTSPSAAAASIAGHDMGRYAKIIGAYIKSKQVR